jgi:oligo-alginate lyase
VQLDRAHSTDGKPHIFDFNYHNYGKQTMQLETTPYNEFPKVNGYMHLEQAQHGKTSSDVLSRFDNEGTAMLLQVLGSTPTEVFQGVAPGPRPAVKVPFVIVRRKGVDVEFITLLIPSREESPKITAHIGKDGTVLVHGPDWVDTVNLGEAIRYHRAIGSSSAR